MKNNLYKQIIEKSPVGYAYYKILLDENNKPCDYEYIEVNPSFEVFTGLSAEDVIGKKASEITPNIRDSKFDWVSYYGDIATNGGEISFEYHSEPLDRWYRVTVYSPQKYYFTTFFVDITKEISQQMEIKSLVTSINDAVFELDENYVFINIMASDNGILFLPQEQIIGKSIEELFSPQLSELFILALKELNPQNKFESLTYPSPTEGDDRWFQANIKYMEIAGKVKYGVLVSDITQQQKLEEEAGAYKKELERHIMLQELLFEISAAFVGAKNANIDAAINTSLKRLGSTVGADRAYIFRYDFVNKICINTYEWCDENILPRIHEYKALPIDALPSWVERHLWGESLYVEDLSDLTNPSERDMLKEYGVKSLLAVPIIVDNDLYGFVGFNSVLKQRLYCDSEQRLLANFGQLLLTILRRKDSEEQLASKKADLERFFYVNLDLLCITDSEGVFITINQAWEDVLGYPMEYLLGKSYVELAHPDDIGETAKALAKLKNETKVSSLVNRYKSSEGKYKYIEWRFQHYGQQIYAAARDITQRKLMEDFLYFQKERFQTTLLSIGDGVISVDKRGRISFINSAAEKLTGWSKAQAAGTEFEKVFNIVNRTSREKSENPVLKVFETENVVELDSHTILIRKDGSEIEVEDSTAPIKSKSGEIQGAVLVFRDVTEKQKVQSQIEYLSFHDYLTGLYNRRYFEEELIRLDTERNLPLSIIMLDVNGLKLTNDAFGHEAGDELLKKVAEIIKNECRPGDIIARMGGDEFAIILPKSDELQASLIKKRISEAASKETLQSLIISVASGYCTKSSASQDINEITKAAENFMYRNKIKSSKAMKNQTFELIISNLYTKYHSEHEHSVRVGEMCERIGRALRLPADELKNLRLAGEFHDIGKIIIPYEMINKPGKLTGEEYDIIKRHPEVGYQILKSVEEYSHLAQYILCHHERFDGNGYPRKQKGNEIPLFARVIAIADAYETITAGRLYSKALEKQDAISELQKNAGTQFDPNLVKIFIKKVLTKN